MAEVKNKVQTYIINYVCDECYDGNMERDGNIVLTSNPPLFPHKCNRCGYKMNFIDTYPKFVYEYEH